MLAFVFTPFYSVGEVHGNFGSVLICFVPRILSGTVAGLSFAAAKRVAKRAPWFPYIISGLLGSLVNTVGVLGGIWIFFGDVYSSLFGKAMGTILITVLSTNGALEMAAAALAALFICRPIKKALEARQ